MSFPRFEYSSSIEGDQRPPSRRPVTRMDERKKAPRKLWIRNPDGNGNEINFALIEAAHRVWERARLIIVRFIGDDDDAPEIVERVVHAASRTMNGQHSIEAIDNYLLRSVRNEAVRHRKRAQRVIYVEPDELDNLTLSREEDLDSLIDRKRSFRHFYSCMDDKTRTMYDFRRLDWSWRKIAQAVGYGSAHSAEVQFAKGLERASMRYGAKAKRPNRPEGSDHDDRT